MSLLLAAALFAGPIEGGAPPSGDGEPGGTISFTRDVRPLLAKRCFACHGPDAEANASGLRLDEPGHDAGPEILARIAADDEFTVMPPPEAGPPLNPAEVAALKGWIDAGADYEPHWAFAPPVAAEIPSDKTQETKAGGAEPARNPIDAFVDAQLAARGLSRSAPADRRTLARRVSLDLTGLPPAPAEADAFAADPAPGAYERFVDRLLASPRYGERWARRWLDLARYSDTNGYEKDRERPIWPYRDWVIRALNANLPYDEFSVLQLAGDLLPGAGTEGQIAAGFHRNTMLNEEGGIDPLQFRHEAVVDRVGVTGVVWLGLSTECAQCHTHKYDPITHTDYYRLFALLNNADNLTITLPDPAVDAARARLTAEADALEAALPTRFPGGADAFDTAFADWVKQQAAAATDWRIAAPISAKSNSPRLETLADGSVFSTGDITKRDLFALTFDLDALDLPGPITGVRIEALPDERLPAGGPGRVFYEGREGTFSLSEVTAERGGQPVAFSGASASAEGVGKAFERGGKAGQAIDGDSTSAWGLGATGVEGRLVLAFAEPVPASGTLDLSMLHERHFAASLGRFRIAFTADPAPLASPLPHGLEAALASDEPPAEESRDDLRRLFARTAPELEEARKPIAALRDKLPEPVRTLTFAERPADFPRPTFRHHRGEYTAPREPVDGGVPAFLTPSDGEAVTDRLALARWLVSDANPLAARVAVNRAWTAFFGAGFLPDAADFGTQSPPPTHPELLDWLAVRFRDGDGGSGDGSVGTWDVKALHRLIVTSATYRQDSAVTPEQAAADPHNRRLARGPRHRLEAELVRDAALAASGLLVERLGGPPVMPPQPSSVTDLAYGGFKWTPAVGPDRFRRSVYTFSKRTAPFAAYAVFDAPSGERCAAVRDRSNTPLQALTLLNDGMFLEYARGLAARVVQETKDPSERADRLFRLVLTRRPGAAERDAVVRFAAAQRARVDAGELDAAAVTHGPADAAGVEDLAAWTLAARAVLNLDEALTKE
ncbi:PSD1 and planctomycete cytochrome C domain-containing protein [Alienimonas californiensis]|uniref:PSD1 and planctomycete cytochrome C domain-containing protein n=1 Tax=Alienimonas californiensis TaxID=2527989 RepID=UPI0013FD09B4|nr:PSD1 and planctomycete cytochrome C domain-containing protein [Alienimonas californiensis]